MFSAYRKNRRKGCSLLLAAAMVLSLALSGCGAPAQSSASSAGGASAAEQQSTWGTPAAEETATAAGETDAAQAPEEPAETGEAEEPGQAAAAEPETASREQTEPADAENAEADEADTEEDGAGIYSYLQGIKAYESGKEWAGDWCYLTEPGSEKQFSSFGCAICCLANMYSTLTDEVCTPDQMYEWTKEYTDYAGGGAVSWSQISQTAEHFGFAGTLCVDDEDYEAFRADMEKSVTILVLVSSDYDDAIWQNLPGHYVNLWEYDPETETVFLTDSGRPSHNRTRVSLLDVYHALYMDDAYQYFMVEK